MFFFFLFFLCSHPLCFFSSFLVYIPKWFLQTGFDCTYTYYPRKRRREETGAWRLAETVWVAHFVVVAALPSHCWKYTEYMYMKYNEQSSEARGDSQTALKRFNFYHDAFHLLCVIFFTNCLVDFFLPFRVSLARDFVVSYVWLARRQHIKYNVSKNCRTLDSLFFICVWCRAHSVLLMCYAMCGSSSLLLLYFVQFCSVLCCADDDKMCVISIMNSNIRLNDSLTRQTVGGAVIRSSFDYYFVKVKVTRDECNAKSLRILSGYWI